MNSSIPDEQLLKKNYFSNISPEDWDSWKWQLKNQITNIRELPDYERIQKLFKDVLNSTPDNPPFAITPYYYSVLLNSIDNNLLKSVIPTNAELNIEAFEKHDPLLEKAYQQTNCIIHRYPNRVLFLSTHQCAVYCRYCTRSRFAGNYSEHISTTDWQAGINYIEKHKEIREVIISGGDPLFLSDDKIEFILTKLNKIPHINLVRLGTKVPIVLPQRITDRLVKILKCFSPLYISLHVIHSDEITIETEAALRKLIDAGCVVISQTVLLKGINDQGSIIHNLMDKLLHNRIKPYALFHCDFISGASHFRTSVNKGVEIIKYLREHASGLAIPHYILDPPGGKVTIAPDNILEQKKDGYLLRNWEGKSVFFQDEIPD